MAFYQLSSVTAMLIAVLAASCMTKGSLNDRFRIFAKGAANGTSMGTISAIVPIAVGLADKGGLSVPMMAGPAWTAPCSATTSP